MPSPPPHIDEALARSLVAAQFPQWAHLAVRPVARSGWDNRTFHLGDDLLIRLPSAEAYAAQVEREHRWLPVLASALPLPVPKPLAMGQAAQGYPWRWSIYRWIGGESADAAAIGSLVRLANDLGAFLRALQSIDAADGPTPGPHNFHRGGSLTVYDDEARAAIAALAGRLDSDAALAAWNAALSAPWRSPPVWVHGDMSLGNLLVTDGRLSAVIDFGQLSVGDPACDLVIAWTLFSGESRRVFRATLAPDDGTWARARGWALWKALMVAAGLAETNALEGTHYWRTISEVVADPGR